jgi:hypothetical protein
MLTLYKYRPFNDYLEPIITSRKIWFPTRAKLNDPEDLQLNLVNDVDPDAYRKFLIRKADQESWSSKHLKYNLKKAFTSKGYLSREAKHKIARSQAVIQKHLDGLGILSLSETDESPLLWERYGDQQRGVCIVFKMELSEYLIKVEYETPRPEPKLSQLLLSVDADRELIRILKTKTTKWSDELEWRSFVRAGNTEFTFLGTIDAIKLGGRMLDAHRQAIAQLAAAAMQPIRIENSILPGANRDC